MRAFIAERQLQHGGGPRSSAGFAKPGRRRLFHWAGCCSRRFQGKEEIRDLDREAESSKERGTGRCHSKMHCDARCTECLHCASDSRYAELLSCLQGSHQRWREKAAEEKSGERKIIPVSFPSVWQMRC